MTMNRAAMTESTELEGFKLFNEERLSTMLKGAKIPPLPEGVARILQEINNPNADIVLLEKLIAAEPDISFRIIAMVNSSLFALRADIKSIRHAITMLGFDRVRSIVIANAMLDALPMPKSNVYSHMVFWTDSLLRALMAKALARRFLPQEEETAFTAALVADVALPILLCEWTKHYEPILNNWRRSGRRLARLEKDRFKWDHAQAGAWILDRWEFPRDLVAFAGGHNLSYGGLRDHGLLDTVAMCVATAAKLPSCARPKSVNCLEMVDAAYLNQNMKAEEWPWIMGEVHNSYKAIHAEFGLTTRLADRIFELMDNLYQNGELQVCLHRIPR
jgi:HD-like signal output (HDOD) protein